MSKLDGEDEGIVPVFDTCDDFRRKMDTHLKKDGVTQAAFARELSKCIPGGDVTVSSKNVTDFRNKRGPMAGNTSKAFYAAYVYFEKLRVKEKKPKSKKRQVMEAVHGFEGVSVDHDLGPNARFICSADARPSMDNLGKMTFG